MVDDDIADVDELCRSIYNEAVTIRERGRIGADQTLVQEDVSPDIYSDFASTYDDELVERVAVYTEKMTTARERESITSSVRLQKDEWEAAYTVAEEFDGIWRKDGLYERIIGTVRDM